MGLHRSGFRNDSGADVLDRDAAPQPPTQADAEIMYEAAERRALLEGRWKPLLQRHVEKQLGALRARLVGEVDTSANLFASTIDQTSTLYDSEPVQDGQPAIADAFDAAGYWSLHAPLLQRYVQGMGECAVYVGRDDDSGPFFELVTRDLMWYETARGNANRIVRFGWARRRPVPGKPGESAWFWDVWDIRSPAMPSFAVFSNDLRRDVTEAMGVDPAEWRGAAYPYRDESGRPLLPFALFRLRGGPAVSCPHMQSEVVFGTLQVGLLWTAAVHGMLRASWDQRVLLNGRVKGGTTEKVDSANGAAVRLLTPDPTMVMQVHGEGAAIDAWGASIDITAAEQFCRLYEARLAVHFGLSPADLVIESLNPASGASITVSQRGKRVLQARQRPQFARGDRQLAGILAAVLRSTGIAASAASYRLRYAGVALTPEERIQVGSYCIAEMSAGLMTHEDAWLELHPGCDPEQAQAAIGLVALEAERRMVVAQITDPGADSGDAVIQ